LDGQEAHGTTPLRGERAVVIGAGMAGLLAARVLSERFGEVVVVERDPAAQGTEPRKGVPQGAHIHLLLIRGAEIMEALLPGLFDGLAEAGGVVGDSTRDLAFFNFGAWQPRGVSHLPARLQTRPFLESHVVRRVEALPNVRFLRRHEAQAPVVDDTGRVRGVEIHPCDGGEAIAVEADLLVDAAGRGSATPRWLREHGWPAPETSEIGMRISYASRLFRVPEGPHDWRGMLVYPRVPEQTRGAALYFQEGDRWIATLGSYVGEDPPRSDEAFLAFAKGLPSPEVYELLCSAEPLGPIETFRYPGAHRRHYERLRRFPPGLVVMGDAVCSFNPVFGQGMTSAALQAEHLATCLDRHGLAALQRPFARGVARICDAPWFLSTSMDLRYPHTVGRRSPLQPLLNWYLDRFFLAMAGDFRLFRDFMRVLHQLASPAVLARPSTLAKVMAAAWRPPQRLTGERPPLAAYGEQGQLTGSRADAG
jgi:2-polyprenyl-6-methoxyphenol hydroxylase-like FAD-dependent oxidoreductase